MKIDPENALRLTNKKFLERVNYIEKELLKVGRKFNETSLEELEELWINAKKEIRELLKPYKFNHSTIEIEWDNQISTLIEEQHNHEE